STSRLTARSRSRAPGGRHRLTEKPASAKEPKSASPKSTVWSSRWSCSATSPEVAKNPPSFLPGFPWRMLGFGVRFRGPALATEGSDVVVRRLATAGTLPRESRPSVLPPLDFRAQRRQRETSGPGQGDLQRLPSSEGVLGVRPHDPRTFRDLGRYDRSGSQGAVRRLSCQLTNFPPRGGECGCRPA